jgi:hypothetical protein
VPLATLIVMAGAAAGEHEVEVLPLWATLKVPPAEVVGEAARAVGGRRVDHELVGSEPADAARRRGDPPGVLSCAG